LQRKNQNIDMDEFKKLHEELMMSVIQFFYEHGITDVKNVVFTADELCDSIAYNKWMGGTDSSLSFEYYDFKQQKYKKIELL